MLIDCDTCRAPADACGDCVMTVLLQLRPRPVEIDDAEWAALGSLAAAGLVPPLRLVVGVESGFDDQRFEDRSAGIAGRDDAPRDDMPDFRGEMSGKIPKVRGIA